MPNKKTTFAYRLARKRKAQTQLGYIFLKTCLCFKQDYGSVVIQLGVKMRDLDFTSDVISDRVLEMADLLEEIAEQAGHQQVRAIELLARDAAETIYALFDGLAGPARETLARPAQPASRSGEATGRRAAR